MATTCTRCEGSGFLNLHQIPEHDGYFLDSPEAIGSWLDHNQEKYPDIHVCDCCGDGETHYGVPGEHYNGEEREGVYQYNGGLCECN